MWGGGECVKAEGGLIAFELRIIELTLTTSTCSSDAHFSNLPVLLGRKEGRNES